LDLTDHVDLFALSPSRKATLRRPVRLTSSRPCHKDDNAHVEQKNWTWPRQLLGYERLADSEQVEPIPALYKDGRSPLHNS
jgi:hypothetical protein